MGTDNLFHKGCRRGLVFHFDHCRYALPQKMQNGHLFGHIVTSQGALGKIGVENSKFELDHRAVFEVPPGIGQGVKYLRLHPVAFTAGQHQRFNDDRAAFRAKTVAIEGHR